MNLVKEVRYSSNVLIVQVERAMSGMLLAMRAFEGLYVLRKAQIIEVVRMKINSFCGKVRGVGMPTNIERNNVMPQPTQVPMTTPEKELDTTRINASYTNSFIMTPFWKPIARITEISFTCS